MRSMIERPNLVLVKTTARAKTCTRWLETSLERLEAEVRERHTLFYSCVLCHSLLQTVNNQSAESQLFQLSYHPLHSHSCLESIRSYYTTIRHSCYSFLTFLCFVTVVWTVQHSVTAVIEAITPTRTLSQFSRDCPKLIIAVLAVRSLHALSPSSRDYT